ncbi:SusC/RagA family TonB-linked outer membrane protein [Sphingobacterium pedocola]|uniref:SusC/RagA family TonB-linked outer membrane protein n=1 Tax=Sphingobacterium pedocola TaxID=2082722 RepID=A0ABR9T331_9SPHI|nr:TonB-dependent receptor [Sphingobacterium pedocola]MBE8719397.1 SusC/RagA family TonB-linked outer membrane protein [Sphingobacterium pedocola]
MKTETRVFFRCPRSTVRYAHKVFLTLFVALSLPLLTAVAQDRIFKGTVQNIDGLPIAGATVSVKGDSRQTSSDKEGNFAIPLTGNTPIVLNITSVGYASKEIVLDGQDEFKTIVLEAQIAGLDEVVVVGYGTQSKSNVTGAISTLKSEELAKVPMSSVTNALVGKLPGLIAMQGSGLPGRDGASLNIRGYGNALIIVDGIEASFNNIDASQIESVTVLKDGAASIYGSRAGNGVILVTTKRGNSEKPTISFNGTSTLQKPTYFQQMLSSGDYTTLVSEEYLQSGQPANAVPYTAEQIQKFYDATEPGYYNTNWQDIIMKDYAQLHNYNMSVRGGSDKIKYYTFLGLMNQGSFWKKNGGDYNRYNLQVNVDANILDNLTLGVTVSNIVDRIKSTHRPQNGGGYLFADLFNNKPMYPASLPDPSRIPYSGSATGGALVQSDMELGGYNNNFLQTLSNTAILNYSFTSIEGLSLKAFGNYSQVNDNVKSYGRPVDMYNYNVGNDTYELVSQFNTNTPLFQQKAVNTMLTGQFSVNYARKFAGKHDVSGMLLHEIISVDYDYLSAGRQDFTFPTLDQMFAGSTSTLSNNGSASQMGRKSFVGRLNYGYDHKYLVEAIIRADASAKFPKDSRWGYFPSISFGWRMNQEQFLSDFDGLDELKLRTSYGASGNDGIGDFQYLAGYGPTLMPVLFDGTPVLGITTLGMANESLSWERLANYNAGLDFSFLQRKIYGEFDVFYRTRNGIPAKKTISLPSSFGAELPLENINSQTNRGFELKIGTFRQQGDWTWDISANVSWQRAKWDHVEEVEYTDEDSKRIYQQSGQWVDRTVGYRSDGLFVSQDQIDNLDLSYPGDPALKLGDVRYIDTNDDGILDWRDMVEIGKGQIPNIISGLNLAVAYRNFDIAASFQGAFGFYKAVSLTSFTQTFFDNRWTEEVNNANSLIPRLGGASTNGLLSDRNFIKSDYLRLRSFTIGYNLPNRVLDNLNMKQARLYLGGTNLFTFSKLNKFKIDPESPYAVQDGQPTTSYYPQQKTIMLGVNVSF